MCTDLDIPMAIFAPQIAASIRTQIEEYAPVAEIQLPENSDLNVIVNPLPLISQTKLPRHL